MSLDRFELLTNTLRYSNVEYLNRLRHLRYEMTHQPSCMYVKTENGKNYDIFYIMSVNPESLCQYFVLML